MKGSSFPFLCCKNAEKIFPKPVDKTLAAWYSIIVS